MDVICLESEALYLLVDKVVDRIRDRKPPPKDKWILPDIAMQQLGIKSKTTLQKLRDEGKIRFSQPQKKIILYDRESIEAYLEAHAKDTF